MRQVFPTCFKVVLVELQCVVMTRQSLLKQAGMDPRLNAATKIQLIGIAAQGRLPTSSCIVDDTDAESPNQSNRTVKEFTSCNVIGGPQNANFSSFSPASRMAVSNSEGCKWRMIECMEMVCSVYLPGIWINPVCRLTIKARHMRRITNGGKTKNQMFHKSRIWPVYQHHQQTNQAKMVSRCSTGN